MVFGKGKQKTFTPPYKGKKLPDDVRLKISMSKKGKSIRHNKQFKKGYTPWNKKNYGTTYKELNHNLRTSKKWISWRTQVFQRDNYTCQECNKTNTTLHPHHIVSVKQCVEINNIDLIYDVKNGITLCFDCHWLKHKQFKEED